MSFIVRNLTAGAIALNDLGLEIAAGANYDMLDEAAQDVQASGQTGGDLNTEVNAGNLIVINPKDGVTQLSQSDSITVIQVHNDPNWGIRGAVINDLDDVDTTGAAIGDVLQIGGTGSFAVVTPSVLGGNIALGDLSDVTDATGHTLGEFYILQGDGAGSHTMVNGATDTSLFVPFLEDTTGNVVGGGVQTDLTFTYNVATNKMDISVDDNFLRNTGDTLDSGTLNIAAAAALVVAAGAVLTITDAPVNGTDAANKSYVDSVAQGTDIKDSVHHATTPAGGDIGGIYNATGGTGGTGAITGIPTTTIDGLTVHLNDRIIVKDQTDAKQNGIYVITAISTSPVSFDIERAPDHDGTPANEVSSGNLAFVETGTVNANTSWIVTGSGVLTLNTDPINWTQFAGSGSFTAGAGLGLNGSEFFLDVNNLTGIAAVGTDEIAFNDVTDNSTKKRSFDSIIADLGIFTDTNLTASDGVLITGGDIQLDITNLPTGGTPSLLAEMVFDAGGTGTHNKATVADFFNGLNVPYNITANGILTRTADDTYASRTITASATLGEEGTTITNGDGVLGNPTIGVNVTGLTLSSNIMASTDELLMFDGTGNVKVSGQQLADGVSAILGGLGNAYTTIQGDTGSATAGSSTDTLAFLGAINGGIATVATDSAPDTVTFAFDLPDLVGGVGTVDLIDIIAVGEGLNTVTYSFQDMITDLGIVDGVGALTGLLVGDGAGNYSTASIAVDAAGALDGLVVANADGVAGNPTVGLDINGNALAAENLAATDKVIAYNASGTANEAFTGQEIATGVSTMLGFGGLAVTTINTQEVLTLVDTTRANKILSVGDTSVTWSENRINNNDWFQIGAAVDAKSGYILPLNATIVKVTAHTADNKGNTKPILLYIDGALNSTIGTFAGIAGEDQFVDATLNIDVLQGQKLRLRGGTGGKIEDTVVTVWLKWRG